MERRSVASSSKHCLSQPRLICGPVQIAHSAAQLSRAANGRSKESQRNITGQVIHSARVRPSLMMEITRMHSTVQDVEKNGRVIHHFRRQQLIKTVF